MGIVLLASYEQPGEYLLLDGETREVIFGPFHSNDSTLIVEARMRRQLRGRHDLRLEWAPRLEIDPIADG